MPDYECILACRDRRLRRGRYWLRLFRQSGGVVAVASEVKGNNGPSVSRAAEAIAAALTERFAINPRTLVLFEHYPPDSIKTIADRQDHWARVELPRLAARFDVPERTELTARDVAQATGEVVASGLPFWQAGERIDSYTCHVGERSASVVRTDVREWHVLATRSATHAILRRGFSTKNEAMCAALDTLANLAAEYDLWQAQRE